jgi:hypothetical protein
MAYTASLPAVMYRFLFAVGGKRSYLVRISIGGVFRLVDDPPG